MGVLQEVFNNPIVKFICLAIAFVLFELSIKLDKKEKPKENIELEEEIKKLKEELNIKE
jgi:hypothetical protein